jgi:flavorubredoxin
MMKKITLLYQSGQQRPQWITAARDPERPNYLIDTNEYLITEATMALLTDPNDSENFSRIFVALCETFEPADIISSLSLLADPSDSEIFSRVSSVISEAFEPEDSPSSLSLWLDFNSDLKCYFSRLRTSSDLHFCDIDESLIKISDEDSVYAGSKLKLQTVPAHYPDFSGNFHLYDEANRLFFSGNVGAAILTEDMTSVFVKDFDRYIRYTKDFHPCWIKSPETKRLWCECVAAMDIDMLYPQHGAIYQGADVERFINWFSELQM